MKEANGGCIHVGRVLQPREKKKGWQRDQKKTQKKRDILTGPSTVIQMVHVLSQKGLDGRRRVHGWPWEDLRGYDAAIACDFPNPMERRDGLIQVDVPICQPIRTYRWLRRDLGRIDRHVAPGLGREENAVDVEVILPGPDGAAEHGFEERDGDVLELDVFDFWPVRRERAQILKYAVLELSTVPVGKLLVAWIGVSRADI